MKNTLDRLFGADQMMAPLVIITATVFVLVLLAAFFGCKLYLNSL